MYLQHTLGFATARRFAVDKPTVALGTFNLYRFNLGPFPAFAFITAYSFSEFIHQLTPFDLGPFGASSLDLAFPVTASFVDCHPFPRITFGRYLKINLPLNLPLNPQLVALVVLPTLKAPGLPRCFQ